MPASYCEQSAVDPTVALPCVIAECAIILLSQETFSKLSLSDLAHDGSRRLAKHSHKSYLAGELLPDVCEHEIDWLDFVPAGHYHCHYWLLNYSPQAMTACTISQLYGKPGRNATCQSWYADRSQSRTRLYG